MEVTLQASAYVEFVSVPSAGVNYVAKSTYSRCGKASLKYIMSFPMNIHEVQKRTDYSHWIGKS